MKWNRLRANEGRGERGTSPIYKYCTSSFNDIVNTDNVRDLRRVVIRYRDYVSDPRAARYIRENYADVLEALGLRIQFYIDGRVRLYLAN